MTRKELIERLLPLKESKWKIELRDYYRGRALEDLDNLHDDAADYLAALEDIARRWFASPVMKCSQSDLARVRNVVSCGDLPIEFVRIELTDLEQEPIQCRIDVKDGAVTKEECEG